MTATGRLGRRQVRRRQPAHDASSARSRPPRASKNADAIAALDGVDCLWVGHFDLSVSLGIPGEFDHPDFTAAIDKRRRRRKHSKSLGRLVPTVEQGIELLRAGLRLHLLFGRCLGAARRAGRGDRQVARRLPAEVRSRWLTQSSAWRSRAISARPTARPPSRTSISAAARAPGVEMAFLESHNPLRAEQLEDFDALILLAHRFDAESVPQERPARGRRALRRRLRHRRRRGLHRGRHRAGHHARRRAPAGRRLRHHA